MDSKELEVKLTSISSELEKFMAKHTEEIKLHGKASEETKQALDKLAKDWNEASARLLAVEQKMTAPKGGPNPSGKSIGQMFAESDNLKNMVKTGASRSGQVTVGDIKTSIVNATGLNQPLVKPEYYPGILMPGLRRLTIRDLLPSVPTTSNLITWVRELSFTNAAAPVTGGSPNANENAVKPESAMTFELKNSPVQTVAHWIPASRQILDDAPALAGYIDARLLFGLKLVEEDQLLNGNGVGTNLSGLISNSTTMDVSFANTTSDTLIDTIRRAITQVQLSFFEPSGVIIHPRDWEAIQLVKTTGTALSGQYIFSNPHTVESNRIWGLDVVPTVAMAQGQFMVGAFNMAAMIWDRNDATVEVSREHSDFFIRNMVAILCEERLALTVFRPLALVYGGFPFGS